MTAADVQEVRNRLLELKEEASRIQVVYREKADQRIAYQEKMAKLNQMVQTRTKDVLLVEDVIVVTLAAETAAQERFAQLPPKPTKQAQPVLPGQKTKSAEEAIGIFQSQIDVLEEEIEYRRELGTAERDMDLIYRQAIDDIVDIMQEYCEDQRLRTEIERVVSMGEAQCSTGKATPKGIRGIFHPKSGKSPVDDNANGALPPTTPKEFTATPKKSFKSMKKSPKLKSPPLREVSDDEREEENVGFSKKFAPPLDLDDEDAGAETSKKTKKKVKKQSVDSSPDNEEDDASDNKKRKSKKTGGKNSNNAEDVVDDSEPPTETPPSPGKKKKKPKKPSSS